MVNQKYQTGFSLIELMVVIAIVAVLAAIAVPAYKSYRISTELSKVFSSLVPNIEARVHEYYNMYGTMPYASDLGIEEGDIYLVNSDIASSGGSYVTYVELSGRVQGQSLCPSSGGCSDLVIAWSQDLLPGGNGMWLRFVEIDGIIQKQCGLHEHVPSSNRGYFPVNCQGISPGYTNFSVP